MYIVFRPIFYSKSLIFPYAIHQFDICKVYPKTWSILKKAYVIVFFIAYNILLLKFFRKLKLKEKNFSEKNYYK